MYEELTIEDYQEQFANNADADYVLIDVRREDEFEAGHLPGAILLPLDELQWRMDEIDEDKHIVFVCRTGARSDTASQILAANGYENVYNLLEGVMGWMRRGYTLETE